MQENRDAMDTKDVGKFGRFASTLKVALEQEIALNENEYFEDAFNGLMRYGPQEGMRYLYRRWGGYLREDRVRYWMDAFFTQTDITGMKELGLAIHTDCRVIIYDESMDARLVMHVGNLRELYQLMTETGYPYFSINGWVFEFV